MYKEGQHFLYQLLACESAQLMNVNALGEDVICDACTHICRIHAHLQRHGSIQRVINPLITI